MKIYGMRTVISESDSGPGLARRRRHVAVLSARETVAVHAAGAAGWVSRRALQIPPVRLAAMWRVRLGRSRAATMPATARGQPRVSRAHGALE